MLLIINTNILINKYIILSLEFKMSSVIQSSCNSM